MHMCVLHAHVHSTCTHTQTLSLSLCGYETGSSKHVQISRKVWRKRCVFSLVLILYVTIAGRVGKQSVCVCYHCRRSRQSNCVCYHCRRSRQSNCVCYHCGKSRQTVWLCVLPLQEEQANTERRKKLLEEYAAKKAKSEYRSPGSFNCSILVKKHFLHILWYQVVSR